MTEIDDDIPVDGDTPVVVRMRVECARCGYTEDDTYEFDLPVAKAQAMEAYEPGQCPVCGGPVQMHLKRRTARNKDAGDPLRA